MQQDTGAFSQLLPEWVPWWQIEDGLFSLYIEELPDTQPAEHVAPNAAHKTNHEGRHEKKPEEGEENEDEYEDEDQHEKENEHEEQKGGKADGGLEAEAGDAGSDDERAE